MTRSGKTPEKVVSKKKVGPKPCQMPKQVIPKKHFTVTVGPWEEGKLGLKFSVIAKIPSLATSSVLEERERRVVVVPAVVVQAHVELRALAAGAARVRGLVHQPRRQRS